MGKYHILKLRKLIFPNLDKFIRIGMLSVCLCKLSCKEDPDLLITVCYCRVYGNKRHDMTAFVAGLLLQLTFGRNGKIPARFVLKIAVVQFGQIVRQLHCIYTVCEDITLP